MTTLLVSARISQICGQFSEILDNFLYLSGAQPIRPDRLRAKKITLIINATIDEPALYLPGIDTVKVRIDDSPYAHLEAYFDNIADRLRKTREEGGRVLVHCIAGVSRSASLVIAYLMKYERMTLRQAYYHVKGKRPIIRPNIGFWKQLIDYERRLGRSPTVQMKMSKFGDPIPDVYSPDLKDDWRNSSQLSQQHPSRTSNIVSSANPRMSLKKRLGYRSETQPVLTTGRTNGYYKSESLREKPEIHSSRSPSGYTYNNPATNSGYGSSDLVTGLNALSISAMDNGYPYGSGGTVSARIPSRSTYYRRSLTPPAFKRMSQFNDDGTRLRNGGIFSSLYYTTDAMLPRL